MSSKTSRHPSQVKRSLTIGFVILKFFVFYRLTSLKKLSFGQRLKLACEALGPVFIKLGQLLGTRYDLLEKADCEALQKLLDDVAQVPYEQVEKLFEADFGKKPNELYKHFPGSPFASASIAQVYQAVTLAGENVAVKVLRPGITKTIRSDIGILKKIVRIAEVFSADLRHIQGGRVLSEMESWIFSETDFGQEVKNVTTLKHFYGAHSSNEGPVADAIVFPKIFPDLCSGNIITMEYIDGIPLNKFKEGEAGLEYDLEKSLSILLRASIRSWIDREETFFHADPHPANIIILKHGRLALVDFGLIVHFTKRDAEETCDLLLAVYMQNLDLAVKYGLKMCRASNKFDTPKLRRDLSEYLEKARESGLGYWFMGYFKVFLKHRIPLPYQLVLLGRANALAEGVVQMTFPEKTTVDLMGPELRRGLYKQVLKDISSIDVGPVMYALSKELKESPTNVARAIQRYLNHPFEFVSDLRDYTETRQPKH